jgi:spectinomycin phosphotransferase
MQMTSFPELSAHLRANYALHAAEISFLAKGADPHSAVYRVLDTDGRAFFFKLRSADFGEASVAVPFWLSQCGIHQVMAPIPCSDGRLYARIGESAAILFPYVEGHDGFTLPLEDRHWIELGEVLGRIHCAEIPPHLAAAVVREEYSPLWRQQVRDLLEALPLDARTGSTPSGTPGDTPSGATMDNILGSIPGSGTDDKPAAALRAFLADRRSAILDLVAQAEQLAAEVQRLPLPYVLCHADIHGGNVLVNTDGDLHLVDWDTVILAPKERDLMFVGGGVAGVWNDPHEAHLFYRGYVPCTVDPLALAYYRCERIVQDIAVTCTQLLESTTGGEQRAETLADLTSQFDKGNVVEIAWRTVRDAQV